MIHRYIIRLTTHFAVSLQSKPEAGGEFSLFGGGVVGKYTSVEKPTSFVQSWKLKSPTWPEGSTIISSIISTQLTMAL